MADLDFSEPVIKGKARYTKRPQPMAPENGRQKGKLGFNDLPFETQQHIFEQMDNKDLVSLQRVSRQFFALASSKIYRDLDFNFVSSDVDSGTPTSRTADALQTIVTSDSAYGVYIRSFRLGVLEESDHNALLMSRVLWDSVADPSKVLNTLILLMLRKALMIEKFLWDTPIELSGPVYQALHKLPNLRHLRVRLDVPASMRTTVHQTYPTTPQMPTTHPPLPHVSGYPVPPGTSPFSNISSTKVRRNLRKKFGSYNYWANGRAFSGFKNLTVLELLGISNLDCLGEVAECMKASSKSLKSLTLSLSNELALRARKPSASTNIVDDPSDSDPDGDDDEMLVEPSIPSGTASGQQPVNEADIRKEKLAQEDILARIFDLQSVAGQGRKLERSVVRPSASSFSKLFEGDGSSFANDLRSMYKLLFEPGPGNVEKEPVRREALISMLKAAQKYLSTQTKAAKKSTKDSSKQTNAESSKVPMTFKPPTSTQSGFETSGLDWAISPSASASKQWSSFPPITDGFGSSSAGFGNSGTGTKKQASGFPESYMSPYVPGVFPSAAAPILPQAGDSQSEPVSFGGSSKPTQHPLANIQATYSAYDDSELMSSLSQGSAVAGSEKLKEVDNAQEMGDIDSENESDAAKNSSALSKPPPFPAEALTSQDPEDSMDIDMEHPDETTIEAGPDQEILGESEERDTVPRKRARFGALPASSPAAVPDSTEQGDSSTNKHVGNEVNGSAGKSADEEMRDYIRATHGLQLEQVSLYLIPLKASILARALDLNVLKRITLLNVGPQDPFWLLLSRLQSNSAQISFTAVHTDNVSLPFLDFLKTFEGLENLFLLERSTKNDADATSTKPTIDIKTIRRTALRKHIRTLRRLLIKNDNDETWDLDANSIRFLSQNGGSLVELGISLSTKHLHILLQKLHTFDSLVALHFLLIRSSDRPPLIHESLMFVADTISHLPDHKLQYIAVESRLATINRKHDRKVSMLLERERVKRSANKSKGKGKAKAAEAISLDDSSGSDDAEEVADYANLVTRLRLGDDFWDVEGIEVFRKEVRTGKI